MTRTAGTLLFIAIFFMPAASFGLDDKVPYVTDKFVIWYGSGDDFSLFEKDICGGIFLFARAHGPGSRRLAEHIDGLLERVKACLGLYPRLGKVDVELFPDQDTLSRAYRELGYDGAPPVAFYCSKTRRIYLEVQSADDYKLAHELTHAIICGYFVVPPPARTQEILAQYVEERIRDGY